MISILQKYWRSIALTMVVVGVLMLALSGYLTPVINAAMRPLVSIQEWFSTRYYAVYEFVRAPREIAELNRRNQELENEIAQLQGQVIELQQELKDTDVLYSLLDFARSRPENKYVAASVIMREYTPFLDYVIINKGSDDGLRHGMPVVTAQGLVGKIDAITAGAARVQLISDPGSSVNVHLQQAGVDAMLIGSLTGDVNIDMLPQDAVVAPGDVVLTSGLGGSYPANLVVGQVVNVRKLETELFQKAVVQPVVDFSVVRAVLIITNFKPVNVEPLILNP